jgi:hypothetical protein
MPGAEEAVGEDVNQCWEENEETVPGQGLQAPENRKTSRTM